MALRAVSNGTGRVRDGARTAGGTAGPPPTAAPLNTSVPTISGSPNVGSTLTGSDGAWSGYPLPTYTRQWNKDGVAISGATGSTYTPVSGDIGGVITFTVTATNGIAPDASATSAGTAAVTSAPVAPANTVAPSISGSPNTGQTLTANNGTWTGNPAPTFAYQWNRGASPISGATGSTYVIVSGDEGSTLSVTVTGTNSQGSASATSSATATVTAGPVSPSNTVAPAISGNPWPVQTLTANTGTWSGNPTPAYTYQWKSGGTNISGATAATYSPVLADLAAVITCAVTATNSQGSASSTTSGVTIVHPALIAPTPSGTSFLVADGDSITTFNSPGSENGGLSYIRQYVTADTSGLITFSNLALSGAKLSDAASRQATINAYIAANPGFANYNLSILIGEAEANAPIDASYYPSGASTFLAAYQAYLQGFDPRWDITIYTYLDRSGIDANYRTWAAAVRTGLLAMKGVYCDEVIDLYSDPIMGVPSHASENTNLYYDGTHPTQTGMNYIERTMAPYLSARMFAAAAPAISSVSITGTAQDGQTLTATANGVTGHSRPVLTYQWKRAGTNISGATSRTYQCVTADVGSTLTCTVTATNQVTTVPATSGATGTVIAVPAPVNTAAPVVTGTPTQGQVLSTTNGAWTNSPTSYNYQWLRGGASISGATNSTYTLVAGDVGANISCGVTAVNGGGSASSTSNALGPVAASVTFLINSLSTAPTAAYSTRKLKSTYSGPAIKVRRSSDSTTQDIGFDSNGDLDAAALATFVGSNSGFIDTWYDQSGNGNDLSQATAANQPRIRNAGTNDTLNGKVTPFWPGSGGNAFALSRATGFPTSANTTCFAIGPQTNTTGYQGIVTGGGTGAGGHLVIIGSGSVQHYFNSGFTTIEPSTGNFGSLAKQASYASFYSAGNYEGISRSGSQRIISSPASISSTEIMVGNYAGLANGYAGAIPEVILFSSIITDADRSAIDASHVAYWGTDAGAFQPSSIAAQTSYTTPTGSTVTFSSEFSNTTYAAWHVFDQTKASHWAPSGGPSGWVARQLSSALTLTRYAVTIGNINTQAPTTWTFEGSNDGSTWTTLDTRTGEASWTPGERRVYTIPSGSRGAYTYHRINVSASIGGSFTLIDALDFITN